jgi:hypothetical protein
MWSSFLMAPNTGEEELESFFGDINWVIWKQYTEALQSTPPFRPCAVCLFESHPAVNARPNSSCPHDGYTISIATSARGVWVSGDCVCLRLEQIEWGVGDRWDITTTTCWVTNENKTITFRQTERMQAIEQPTRERLGAQWAVRSSQCAARHSACVTSSSC